MSPRNVVGFASRALCVLFALGACAARAENPLCNNEQSTLAVTQASLVILQLAPLCYGVVGEDNELTKSVQGQLKGKATVERMSAALNKLAAQVSTETELYRPDAARSQFIERIERHIRSIESLVPPGNVETAPVQWKVQGGDTVPTIPALHLSRTLDDACVVPNTTDDCKKAIATTKAWLRVVQLAEGVLTRYGAEALVQREKDSKLRLGMWHSYRDDAVPQYPWEWFLNSWFMSRDDNRERDRNGQPIGPQAIPTSQVIFLHPGVALEWRDSEEVSKLKPAAVLEVLGRYRWSWDTESGKMIGGSGLSLIATYTDRENETEMGYGLMFRWRKTKQFSFAVTRSGSTTNFLVNADFGEYVKDNLGYWKDVGKKMENGQ